MTPSLKMNSKPLVSIIIPFLNTEKFIQEAIESVLFQTYTNWELLLVDDGSTDGSTQIAFRYAEQYPEAVRYLEHGGHENRGASAARNLGIAHAKGDYIAFLDADDVWLPAKLQQQLEIMESHVDVGMVYGPAMFWHNWTGTKNVVDDFIQGLGLPSNIIADPPMILTRYLRNVDMCPLPSCALIRRSVVENVRGFENTFRRVYTDQVFLAKICLENRVFVSGDCWVKYRIHDNSSCASANRGREMHDARLAFLRWLEKYLLAQQIKNGELWKILRRELWSYRHPILFRLSLLVGDLKTRTVDLLKEVAWNILPVPIHTRLKAQWLGDSYNPPVGYVRFGNLRRTTPFSRVFGFDRGLPIDRYYIERFLSAHASDIGGRVLEIGDDSYTRRFGGSRVTVSDVLHVTEGNPKATVVGDLTSADQIPSDTFDCVIITQTLQLVFDLRAAVRTLHRLLKPNGIILATIPQITQISRYDMDQWGEYWRFTTLSARRLFEEVFTPQHVTVDDYGNVLAAMAFLHGLAAEELQQEELDQRDPDYGIIITVRAVKDGAAL